MRTAVLVIVLGCSGSAKPAAETSPAAPAVEARPVESNRSEPPAVVAEPVTAKELEPVGARPPENASNDVAWRVANDGLELVRAGKWPEASMKFRDAVARVPEAVYFFNLCVTLYQEAKFEESLAACNAVANQSPKATLKKKTDRMIARIKKVNP